MTPADIILQAGMLLADPARWCQGALARDARGVSVGPTSRRAQQWCSAGVAYHVARVKPDRFDKHDIQTVGQALAAIDLAALTLYRMGHNSVNDSLGYDAVMQMLRLAYKRAKHGHAGD